MVKGYVHPEYWSVANAFKKQLKNIKGGAAICVYHKGKPVVDIWGGVKDLQGNPWEEDTLAMCYSTTKGVTATMIHILADRGLINYDALVSEYWPEFGQNGKSQITVRHLLGHEAGLYNLRGVIDDFDATQDWKYMANRLAESQPSHSPGRSSGYHALTYGWLLGEIIERVTHKPFSEVVYEELVQPLNLDGFYIGAPKDQLHRVSNITDATTIMAVKKLEEWTSKQAVIIPKRFPLSLRRLTNSLLTKNIDKLIAMEPEHLQSSIPAANGLFTARSLAKVYATLAEGGAIDNVRLLSEERIESVTRVHNRKLDRVVPVPFFWRMGYHSVPSSSGFIPKAFGHFGFGGSGGWADPSRNLAMAMTLTDSLINPMSQARSFLMSSAVSRAVS